MLGKFWEDGTTDEVVRESQPSCQVNSPLSASKYIREENERDAFTKVLKKS